MSCSIAGISDKFSTVGTCSVGVSNDFQTCLETTVPSFFVSFIVVGVANCAVSTCPTISGPVPRFRFVGLFVDMMVKKKWKDKEETEGLWFVWIVEPHLTM